MPDFKMGGMDLGVRPNLGLPPDRTETPEKAHAAIQTMAMGKQNLALAGQDAEKAAKTGVMYDPVNDVVNVNDLPGPVFRSFLESRKQVDRYQMLYNDMIAENLRKQQAMKEHPFANTLAELASSFARNDPNPYTRAIGQAATRLNPSQQELQGEERGLLKEAESFAARRESIDASMMRAMEGMDARKQANFTRVMGIVESAAKTGNNKPAYYDGLLARAGLSAEERAPIVKEMVERGQQVVEFKQKQQEWKQTKEKEDQRLRENHNKAMEALRGADTRLRSARFELQKAYGDGTKIDIPKMLNLKARLLHDMNALDASATKLFTQTEERAAEIKTKYLGYSSLDQTGDFGKQIGQYIQNAESSLSQGQQGLQEKRQAYQTMIDQIEAVTGGPAPKGKVTVTPSFKKDDGGRWDKSVFDQFKKKGTVDSWDEVPENTPVLDEDGKTVVMKVNGKKVKVQ